MSSWEQLFEQHIAETIKSDDPAHDHLHFKRVAKMAKNLCEIEKGTLEVVIPAAWLHDLVVVPKNSPQRALASKLSANAAIDFLDSIHYPSQYFENIAHAIEGHSFSANIEVKTLEAKIVQDADRLDGIGAIGVARCFATAGLLKRPFYAEEDPFCKVRPPDDGRYTIDHFYKKLFNTATSLQTSAGREEGLRRANFMRSYLEELAYEIRD